MLASQNPAKIPLPWATSGLRRAIPSPSQAGITPGAASWTDGFPSPCFQDLTAGGIPPDGYDMNGSLYVISAGLQWVQAYGINPFDATFAAAIGGYPAWATVRSVYDQNVLFISGSDNNATDPGSTGNGAWVKYILPTFTPVQQGGGTGQLTNKLYMGYSSSSAGVRVQVDATDFGNILFVGPAIAAFAKTGVSTGLVLTNTFTSPGPGGVYDSTLTFTLLGAGSLHAHVGVNVSYEQPIGPTLTLFLDGAAQNAPAGTTSMSTTWGGSLAAGAHSVTARYAIPSGGSPGFPYANFGLQASILFVAQ